MLAFGCVFVEIKTFNIKKIVRAYVLTKRGGGHEPGKICRMTHLKLKQIMCDSIDIHDQAM